MAWVVRRTFTSDERFIPDIERIESPKTWGPLEWHRRRFNAEDGAVVGYLQDSVVDTTDFLVLGSKPIVCDVFKELVEALEPGIHQFLPAKLMQANGQIMPKKFWALNILQSCEPIIAEKSNVTVFEETTEHQARLRTSRYLRLNGQPRLTVSKDVVAGRHLWRSRELPAYIFFSEELMARVQDNRLEKLDRYPVIEE